MIKLIATDIDGTLLDANRFISPATVKAFAAFDIPKILISARMPSAMYYLQEALNIKNSALVCYNGALVLDKTEVLLDLSIQMTEAQKFAQIASKHDLHLSIYRHDEWYVPQLDQWAQREINNTRVEPQVQSTEKTLEYLDQTSLKGTAHKVMLMGDANRMDKAYQEADQQMADKVHLYRSKDTYTEVTPRGTSKLVALKILLQQRFPEVLLDEVVAFGDNYNDEEMLGAVGYGVAVENARDVVKQAARYLTSHHKKDGVATWLTAYKKGRH